MISRHPLIIAHRGANRELPENTIPAFSRALELGADGIELDILLTCDGVPIVTHNDDLSILTAFNGYAHSTTHQKIKELDVGMNSDKPIKGIGIPTLLNVLSLLRKQDILIVFEIKGQLGFLSKAARTIGRIINETRFKGQIILSSSNVHILYELSWLYPKLRRAVIIHHSAFSFFIPSAYARLGLVSSIHPSIKALNKGMVSKAREMGLSIFPWTVNNADDIDRCIGIKADGIITDEITYVRGYLNS